MRLPSVLRRVPARLALLASLTGTGCGGDPPAAPGHLIQLQTERASYRMSELADGVRVRAIFPSELPVYGCRYCAALGLQRLDGAAWVDLPKWYGVPEPGTEYYALTAAEKAAAADWHVMRGLDAAIPAPGTYRLTVLYFQSLDPLALFPIEERSTNAFTVRD